MRFLGSTDDHLSERAIWDRADVNGLVEFRAIRLLPKERSWALPFDISLGEHRAQDLLLGGRALEAGIAQAVSRQVADCIADRRPHADRKKKRRFACRLGPADIG